MKEQYMSAGEFRLRQLLCEFEGKVVEAMYPNLGKPEKKRLLRLCRDKTISLVDMVHVESTLDNMLCSIIRHNCTTYEGMVAHVEKYKARAIVQPIVARELKSAKGTVAVPAIRRSTPVVVDKTMTTFEHRPTTAPILAIHLNNQTFENHTGKRIGHFVVCGLSKERKNRWVIQCDCGLYAMTSAKNIKNGMHSTQKCAVCLSKERR